MAILLRLSATRLCPNRRRHGTRPHHRDGPRLPPRRPAAVPRAVVRTERRRSAASGWAERDGQIELAAHSRRTAAAVRWDGRAIGRRRAARRTVAARRGVGAWTGVRVLGADRRCRLREAYRG